MISQQRLRPYLLEPNLSDATLVRKMLALQEHYTDQRRELEHRTWDEADVSSYACLYLATNYPKFLFLKEQLPADFFTSDRPYNVIDFGTGPGTYLLSFLDHVGDQSCHKLYGIDNNALMLKQARKLIEGLHPSVKDKLIWGHDESVIAQDVPCLLLFGHSMNELSVDQVKKVIERINPEKILFIEPGTPYVFEQMMPMRDFLRDRHYQCLYPCPSIEYPCPIAQHNKKKPQAKDWCHQVWRGSHEQETERLTQLLRMDRRSMPMIAHAYAKDVVRNWSATGQAQMIRFLRELKHAFLWQVCLLEEGELKTYFFEIIKKTMSKKQVKAFKKISVGERIDYTALKKIDSHTWRVSLVGGGF